MNARNGSVHEVDCGVSKGLNCPPELYRRFLGILKSMVCHKGGVLSIIERTNRHMERGQSTRNTEVVLPWNPVVSIELWA